MGNGDQLAYIVIYSRKSGSYGFGDPLQVLWKAQVEDAKRICSDERTAGSAHFLGWVHCRGQRIRWAKDSGQYDDVLRDLGLQKERYNSEVVLKPIL